MDATTHRHPTNPTGSPAGDAADRTLVITRVFDAPRELVFKAWTDPKHLINWWGPRGFTNTFHEVDIRPGGIWRFTMHGADGTDYPNVIVYDEVIPPKRLAYTHGSGEPNDPMQFQVTVTFADRGPKTELTMRSLFASTDAFNQVKAMGAVEGANSTLDRLAEELVRLR